MQTFFFHTLGPSIKAVDNLEMGGLKISPNLQPDRNEKMTKKGKEGYLGRL